MNQPTPSIERRGGARRGAGRKPRGRTTVNLVFSLPIATANALRELPEGTMSQFVNRAIQQAFHG